MPVPSQIVVVDNPDRRLEGVLDADVTLAIQQQPRGTADAARAGVEGLAAGNTVVVLNGDAPLLSAEAIRSLVDAHERAVAAATIGTVTLDDASGYGRVVRDPNGMVQRVVETKTPGDATEAELRDPRGQHRAVRLRRRRAAGSRLTRSTPTTPRASCTSPTCSRSSGRSAGRSSPTASPTHPRCSASTTGSRSPT